VEEGEKKFFSLFFFILFMSSRVFRFFDFFIFYFIYFILFFLFYFFLIIFLIFVLVHVSARPHCTATSSSKVICIVFAGNYHVSFLYFIFNLISYSNLICSIIRICFLIIAYFLYCV
jgi:hypothetical protein